MQETEVYMGHIQLYNSYSTVVLLEMVLNKVVPETLILNFDQLSLDDSSETHNDDYHLYFIG